MNNQNFSIVEFYERRARRIIPALFFVILCCLPFAWFWLPPNNLKDFGKSLIAVVAFSSNVLFWKESGYFSVANELKPLLHTWSLAVEEQFYVLFPLFLAALWKLRKRWIFGSLSVIGVISLTCAQWGAFHNPEANFFLLPTRIWELAIGALIAFFFLYRRDQIKFVRLHKQSSEIFALIGIILIAYSICNFDKHTPFPSLYALFPTIGAGLIIVFATRETYVGRILGMKPMVGIGLISFSAYLWHQPLFVFARFKSHADPGGTILLSLSAASLLLAFISWRFVEQPFRNKSLVTRRNTFLFTLTGSLFFVFIGVAGIKGNGFVGRFGEKQQNIYNFERNYDHAQFMREGTCFLRPDQGHSEFLNTCNDINQKEVVMLWGDSHAASIYWGLKSKFGDLVQINSSGCPPIFEANPLQREFCNSNNRYAKQVIQSKQPKIIFLVANWMLYKDWTSLENPVISKQIESTVKEIRRISPISRVVIIGSAPQWGSSLPSVINNFADFKFPTDEEPIAYLPLQDGIYSSLADIDAAVEKAAIDTGTTFISLIKLFCGTKGCPAVLHVGESDIPTAWDYGHLTKDGAELFASEIFDALKH